MTLFQLVGITFALTVASAVLAPALAQNGFTDHGVGAKVAECRGVVTLRDGNGRNLVIALTLDESPRGYILVTDIDTGETKQYWYPEGVGNAAVFASLMSRNGRFYTGAGKVLLEFDPTRREWLFHGVPQQEAACFVGSAMADGPDGLIFAGTYPNCHLVSFNPQTKEMKDYGQLDPAEHYFNTLAFDSAGWAYAGIGTARWNIVACNPRTGERRQILAEEERQLGTATVYTGQDGKVYGIAGAQWFRLFEGKGEKINPQDASPRAPTGAIGWGQRTGTFPDGRQLVFYDLENRRLRVADPKTGQEKEIAFDYEAGGVMVTSLATGPEDIVYASTAHPMHLLKLDPRAKSLQDLGPIPRVGGGNFCSMARCGNLLIGAQYSAGALWAYDVTRPWNPRSQRKVVGLPAQELVKRGQGRDGHFTYLADHDVAFFHGDKFGAEGSIALIVPKTGRFYLHILPYTSERYCTVQFLFDGKEIGKPFVATSKQTRPGELLVFGPLDLRAGEHTLTLRTLETKGQEPWCALVAVDLSAQKKDRLIEEDPGNPRVLAEWHDDICRPRAALTHPDGKHVMMSGFAGYGRCGGGIGIYNLETGEATLLTADKDLLPGHSTIALKALPDGNLVGGTSIEAPGGGHPTAKAPELYLLDWKTRKIIFHAPVLPGAGDIISLEVGGNSLIYGLTANSTFFVFDPRSKQITHQESFAAYGGVPRHALHWGPDGKLFAMLSKAILRINPGSLQHEKLADSPVTITAGGALAKGFLCFASGAHLWSYQIPGLGK